MLISGGRIVLADSTPATTSSTLHYANDGLALSGKYASYATIYRSQPWVYACVRKRALAVRRLPVKVYRRTPEGRIEQREHPLFALLHQPNPRMSGAFLWEWTCSTMDIYGEAIWIKVRGRNGQPAELLPIHPSNVAVRYDDDGEVEYVYGPGVLYGSEAKLVVPARDVVHFKTYNPDSTTRGLSPLEPLRQTLINEDAATRASSAFWKNGARPSGFLSHPGRLSPEAMARLRAQWDASYSGVDATGKFAILEEGMEPKTLQLTAEESQWLETRRLNRETVISVYDLPAPAVGVLDRANYSNVVALLRSLYRDSIAPMLSGIEAVLSTQLTPDFHDPDIYVEHVFDEVLRGDMEQRIESYTKLHALGLPLNRILEWENQAPVEGGDVSMVNAALVPLVAAAERTRELNPAAAPVLPADTRSLDSAMGMLGRVKSVDSIDIERLCERLIGHGPTVRALHAAAVDAGMPIDDFRGAVRHVLTGA